MTSRRQKFGLSFKAPTHFVAVAGSLVSPTSPLAAMHAPALTFLLSSMACPLVA